MTSQSRPAIEPNEDVPFMNIDETDFTSMSRAEQIRRFEVEGYVVLPGILDADVCARISREMADAETWHPDYSPLQMRSKTQPQWVSRAVAELIGFPPMVDLLNDLLGPDIVFTRGFFQRTMPETPGISMHTDGQPHGSDLFGFEGSCPRLLRVLYYLDELTPDRAPFRLLPRSHLSFHGDASPYARYQYHPEEITLLVPAGSAVVVPSMLLHGSHPNRNGQPRELVQLGYRPAWAGPIQPVDEWDPKLVEAAPDIAKPFLQLLNTTGFEWVQPNKPSGMRTEGAGINPSRWGND
ncbi:MAG: hypothetical protein CMJ18_03815 [Phycisphaeraceae bacterium]|nr:hypothetical protein [Phycisphaeraceae bacterium]